MNDILISLLKFRLKKGISRAYIKKKENKLKSGSYPPTQFVWLYDLGGLVLGV